MIEKIKKIFKNGRGIIFAIFILEVILMFFVTPNKYDDEFFINQVTNQIDETTGQIIEKNIFDFVKDRYFSWTSRVMIEFMLCLVLKTSKYLWILLEALLVTLAMYSISKIFIKENKYENNLFLLFLFLLYPLNEMNSAGWAATTVNYMWPLALGLFALIPINKIWNSKKIKLWQYPLYSLALIFAANQEIMCAILLSFYGIFAVLMILKNKKINPYMLVQIALVVVSLVFILTCPGNYLRNQSEIIEQFKDFEMYTFLDKIGLGLTSTMGELINNCNLLFLILTIVISVYIFLNYKEKLYRIVATIPLFSIVVLGFGTCVKYLNFSSFGMFKSLLVNQEVMLTAANSNNMLYAVPIIFAAVNFLCVAISILLIFKNLNKSLPVLIFLAGLSSKIIMGFSPTVFASAGRTMIFFDFSMIIVIYLIWQEIIKKVDKQDKKIVSRTELFIKCSGVLQYLNILLLIFMTQK